MSSLYQLDPSPSSSDQSFHFKYTVFRVVVEIKAGYLIAKTTTKTSVVPLKSLRSFFVHKPLGQDVMELVLAYESKGKLKRARIFSDPKQEGFEELLKEIQWRCPQGDLSHLSAQEAYAEMGSQELAWIVIPALLFGCVLLVALCGLPLLMHGLDHGKTAIDLNHIYTQSNLAQWTETLESSNLEFQGKLDLDNAVHEINPLAKGFQYHIVAPVLPTQASSSLSLPVRIIVSIRGTGDLDLEKFQKNQSYQGILRNIGWEGLSSIKYKELRQKEVELHPNFLYIELNARNHHDLLLYLFLVGFLLMITLGVAFFLKPSTQHHHL